MGFNLWLSDALSFCDQYSRGVKWHKYDIKAKNTVFEGVIVL